jgi:hypothetical protein
MFCRHAKPRSATRAPAAHRARSVRSADRTAAAAARAAPIGAHAARRA